MEKFEKLIDTLHKLVDQKEIEDQFLKITTYLMNKLCIHAGERQFKVIECEIYYNDNYKHKDPYPYGFSRIEIAPTDFEKECFEQQKKKLHWFFHYSGVDLTIGNNNNIIGGILIRAIKDVTGNSVTGPLKVMQNILSNTFYKRSSEQDHVLYLGKLIGDEVIKPITSERIGLDSGKRKQEFGEKPFYKKEYNYATKEHSETKKYIADRKKQRQNKKLII